MPARIIDGKAVAAAIRVELSKEVAKLCASGVVPRLAVLLVGEDAASRSYVTAKERAAPRRGFRRTFIGLMARRPPRCGRTGRRADRWAQRRSGSAWHDPATALARGGQRGTASCSGSTRGKMWDALHPKNQGRIVVGQARFYPATPHGVQQLLVRCGADPGGKHVVIVGRSRLVGLSLAAMLVQKRAGANATVTVCHTGTPDLGAVTRQADILIAAAGQPQLISAGMVRPGAVVIDVGVNRVDDATRKRGYRLVGDVDFDGVSTVAEAITPVPGGVGPMTVTMLLSNVARAARMNR